MNYTEADVKDLIDEARQSSAKIVDSPNPRLEDKIINKHMEGDCIDTIRRNLKMSYAEVEEILIDSGLI